MNKRIYILYTICLLLLSGCSGFLEVTDKGKTTIPTFFSDVNGLNAGLVGAYNKTYTYYDNEFGKYADVAGNMLRMNYITSSADMIDQYNYTSTQEQQTGAVGYIWRRILEALANANNVIQYEPSVLSSYPTEKDKCQSILAEALFLRALCHFDLCRVYAQPYNYTSDASHLGVPILLKTPGPDDNMSRQTVKAVYDQIITDLQASIVAFGNTSQRDIYHASIIADYALLTRIYLYKEDWNNVVKYAELIKPSVPLATNGNYLNMYRDLNTTGEVILRLNGTDQSGKLKTFYDSSVTPADTLLSLYDANDIRLQLLRLSTGGAYCCKYYPSVSSSNTDAKRDDPFVLRVSEVYLNEAEAYYNIQQYSKARDLMKQLLVRAVNETYANTILSGYSDIKLIDLIKTERVKELCAENHNFFDIVRWKQDLVREKSTNSIVKYMKYPSDYFVLPIPLDELNANHSMQPNPTVNQ